MRDQGLAPRVERYLGTKQALTRLRNRLTAAPSVCVQILSDKHYIMSSSIAPGGSEIASGTPPLDPLKSDWWSDFDGFSFPPFRVLFACPCMVYRVKLLERMMLTMFCFVLMLLLVSLGLEHGRTCSAGLGCAPLNLSVDPVSTAKNVPRRKWDEHRGAQNVGWRAPAW